MKKVLFVGMVFGALALTSCKKDYVCKFDSDLIPNIEYNDLKKDAAKTAKTQCQLVGGAWSAK